MFYTFGAVCSARECMLIAWQWKLAHIHCQYSSWFTSHLLHVQMTMFSLLKCLWSSSICKHQKWIHGYSKNSVTFITVKGNEMLSGIITWEQISNKCVIFHVKIQAVPEKKIAKTLWGLFSWQHTVEVRSTLITTFPVSIFLRINLPQKTSPQFLSTVCNPPFSYFSCKRISLSNIPPMSHSGT